MKIKICGVTTDDAVDAAVRSGVEAVGFVFSPSPRRVSIDMAQRLARRLPPFVIRVAVFRLPTVVEVRRVLDGFHPHVVQTEPSTALRQLTAGRADVLPVFHDHEDVIDEAVAYHEAHGGGALLEAGGRGGRGVVPDWNRAAGIARAVPLVLAGGLHPDNVADAVRTVRPFAVDVSSGVESEPGVKDAQRIEAFVHAARGADRPIGMSS